MNRIPSRIVPPGYRYCARTLHAAGDVRGSLLAASVACLATPRAGDQLEPQRQCEPIAEQLCRSDFDAQPIASGQEALRTLRETDCDVVLLDIMMPKMSGLDTLREIRRLDDPPEVIMLTADNSLATGIEAMRYGAYDYLTKPATLDEMEAVIRKAEGITSLVDSDMLTWSLG